MSYNAHEWQNGETITADKLNNLEEGIQEAAQSGGCGNPLITVIHEWASYTHLINFAFCTYNAQYDCYEAQNIFIAGYEDVNFIDIGIRPYNYTDYVISPLPIPPEGLYLCVWFNGNMESYNISVSGDISSEQITISYGTSTAGYIVTGNCTITVTD